MSQAVQQYSNHAKLDPPFHFFLAPVMLANVVVAIVAAVHEVTPLRLWLVVVSIALFVMTGMFRMYSLKVQDRVIRLEEQLRMMAVLPAPMRARTGELTVRQLIALRFASDAELPTLVERTLAEGLAPKQIKQAITTWRADYERV